MNRRRLWCAWRVLLGRPFDIGFQWGKGGPHGRIHIAALTVPTDREDLLLSIGSGDWLWDGEPFPWATMGDFILTFGDEVPTTVQVTIPVRMAGASAPESERAAA
jgi:hypothetical protein